MPVQAKKAVTNKPLDFVVLVASSVQDVFEMHDYKAFL